MNHRVCGGSQASVQIGKCASEEPEDMLVCLLSFCGGARPLEHLQESPETSVDTFVCWQHCVNSHDRLEITYFSLPSDGLQRERVHTPSCETVQLAYRCSGKKTKVSTGHIKTILFSQGNMAPLLSQIVGV